MKIVIIVALVAAFIPAIAVASPDLSAQIGTKNALIQPPKLDCRAGGVIADATVTRKSGTTATISSISSAFQRYQLACGMPRAAQILITNK
ncbi:hypothetical protein HAP94_08450 [Acidithiobacillus ferrivorans]|nr:hypothetical protein [Acidithiobacillus ferrivorans]